LISAIRKKTDTNGKRLLVIDEVVGSNKELMTGYGCASFLAI